MRRFLIAAFTALAFAGAARADPGAWQVQDKVEALDNTHEYVASVVSDETLTNHLGRPGHAVLSVFCGRNGFHLQVTWPERLRKGDVKNGDTDVSWKLDDGAVQTGDWFAGKTWVGRAGNSGLSTLKSWSSGTKIVVRVPDLHGGQDATFDITGVDQVFAHVSQTGCG